MMCGAARHHERRRTHWADDRVADTEEARDAAVRSFMAHAQRAGTVMVICLLVWLLTGAAYFWPGWVMLFLGLKLGAHARSVYSRPAAVDAEI